MSIVDENGRIYRVVNVVDLLVVLLVVAVVAAASALLLPGSIAGIAVLGLGIVSLAGLIVLSRRRNGVSWGEVRSAMRPEFSRPTLGGVKRWFTAEPDPDVVVIDLRETVTVAPFIVAMDWTLERASSAYRGSWLESALAWVRRGVLGAPVRVASVALLAFALVDGVADVLLNLELFAVPVGTDGGLFEWGARVVVLAVLLVGVTVDASWSELRETRVVRTLADAFAPPEPPTEPGPESDGPDPSSGTRRPQRRQDPGDADGTGDQDGGAVAGGADDATGAAGREERSEEADAR